MKYPFFREARKLEKNAVGSVTMSRGEGGGYGPARAPPTLPPPPDEGGGAPRLAALLSHADQLLLRAEFDTDTPQQLSAALRGVETDSGQGAGGTCDMSEPAPNRPNPPGGSLADRLLQLYASEAVKETRR